jgi:hypothetical protein
MNLTVLAAIIIIFAVVLFVVIISTFVANFSPGFLILAIFATTAAIVVGMWYAVEFFINIGWITSALN